jgi:hypothetical protein
VRVEVVAGEYAGELLVAQRFEVARRREVPVTSGAPRQRAVGDLPEEAVDEAVLAVLRRALVRVERHQFLPGKQPEARLHYRGVAAAHVGQRVDRERAADHRGVLEERPIGGVQGVKPRGDQGVE